MQMPQRHQKLGSMRFAILRQSTLDVVDDHGSDFFHPMFGVEQIGGERRGRHIREVLMFTNGVDLLRVKAAKPTNIDH